MDEGAYGLIGALIGGGISLATSFGLDHLRQARDAHSLAHAFRGGVSAILAIVEQRQYVRFIEGKIEAVRQGDLSPVRLKAKRNYVELYSKNVDQIGFLTPALGEKLPKFYTFVNSLLEDIDNLTEGHWNDAKQEQLLALYVEFHGLLVTTIALGKDIQETVEREYPVPFTIFRLPG